MYPEQTSTSSPAPDLNQSQQQKHRKIIGAIFALGILLIVTALIVALLAGSNNQQGLGIVTARHTETIRLLEAYGDRASSSRAKSLVTRTLVVFKSDLRELEGLGAAPAAEQQQAALIPGIDEVLQDAARRNRFDDRITDYIENVIAENTTVVQQVLQTTDDEKLQLTLDSVLENYENLL